MVLQSKHRRTLMDSYDQSEERTRFDGMTLCRSLKQSPVNSKDDSNHHCPSGAISQLSPAHNG